MDLKEEQDIVMRKMYPNRYWFRKAEYIIQMGYYNAEFAARQSEIKTRLKERFSQLKYTERLPFNLDPIFSRMREGDLASKSFREGVFKEEIASRRDLFLSKAKASDISALDSVQSLLIPLALQSDNSELLNYLSRL